MDRNSARTRHTNTDSSLSLLWLASDPRRKCEQGKARRQRSKAREEKQACDEGGNKARQSGPASVSALT